MLVYAFRSNVNYLRIANTLNKQILPLTEYFIILESQSLLINQFAEFRTSVNIFLSSKVDTCLVGLKVVL